MRPKPSGPPLLCCPQGPAGLSPPHSAPAALASLPFFKLVWPLSPLILCLFLLPGMFLPQIYMANSLASVHSFLRCPLLTKAVPYHSANWEPCGGTPSPPYSTLPLLSPRSIYNHLLAFTTTTYLFCL